ncbi:MAG TPA: hypothetical protein VM487_07455 [Phycisphaerae bacterium]|nr:hypothetical protein [Phycisphaerae bacterium]
MPRLPGTGPSIERVAPAGTPLGRRASAEDFGSGEGDFAIGQALSRTGDVALQLVELHQTSKANRAIAESASALQQFEAAEASNPDFTGREQRFAEQAEKLKGQYGSDLLPRFRDQFSTNFDFAAARSRVGLRAGARKDTIDDAKATLDISAREFANFAALTPPDRGRQMWVDNYSQQVKSMVEQGLLTDQDAVKRLYDFNDSIMSADVLQSINDDPLETINALQDYSTRIDPKTGALVPNSRFDGMTVQQRTVWTSKAVARYEADLRAENGAEARQEKAEAETLKALRKATVKRGDVLVEDGRFGELEAFISEHEDILETSELRDFRKKITEGSGLATQSNRTVLSELYSMVETDAEALRASGKLKPGETVADVIDRQWRSGLLSKADRDTLDKATDDHRFKFASDYLKGAFDAGDTGSVLDRIKYVEAQSAFAEWKNDNPDATRIEAREFVSQLVRDGTFINSGTSEAFQLAPSPHMIFDDKGVFHEELSTSRLVAAFEAGRITEHQLKYELVRIEMAGRQVSRGAAP